MTTVILTDKILYVDRQQNYRLSPGELTHTCLKCQSTDILRSRTGSKLILPGKEVHYRGGVIKAFATLGNTLVSGPMIKSLLAGFCPVDTVNRAELLMPMVFAKRGAVVVVTDKDHYFLELGPGVRAVKQITTLPFSAGSGATDVNAVAKIFPAASMEQIMATVSELDGATGEGIDLIKYTRKIPRIVSILPPDMPRALVNLPLPKG